MRFHILGLPHTISSKLMLACAFTQKIVKFCKMMKCHLTEQIKLETGQEEEKLQSYYAKHLTNHYIIHYGHEDSQVECDEHISVITQEIWLDSFGHYDWKKEVFKQDKKLEEKFAQLASIEIAKRVRQDDIILLFWGVGHTLIYETFKNICIVVEPGIGYLHTIPGTFKVFESYAWMHEHYGVYREKYNTFGNWYDTVIPNYFDEADFLFEKNTDLIKEKKYFLFLGRILYGKGISIVIDLARHFPTYFFLIAGQGNLSDFLNVPENVQFVGYADEEKRRNLLTYALALLVPSLYIEPFGGVVIEAFMSGTPVITSDFGAFTEINLHGITGFRCRTFSEFVCACEQILKGEINREKCREWAIKNFSLPKIRKMYEHYFRSLHDLKFKKGWYEKGELENLDFLKKEYPL